MAHEVERMFSVQKTPWHGLGKIVSDAPTAADAIEMAGLNWGVGMRALQTVDGGILVKNRAIVRETDNSVLGVTGPEYVPLQNEKAFEFFNPFLEAGECSLETAGSLRQGRRIWVMAKLNRDPIKIAKNDVVDKFLLLSNSHEGRSSVRVGFTPIRVVCANTLAMAHNDGRSSLLRVRHNSTLEITMQKVHEVVNLANASFEATAEQYRVLAKSSVHADDLKRYVTLVFFGRRAAKVHEKSERMKMRMEKMTETITRLFETGRGNDTKGVRGTYWALYNAATEYLSYEALKTEDQRMMSLWFGRNLDINNRALGVAYDMAVDGGVQ